MAFKIHPSHEMKFGGDPESDWCVKCGDFIEHCSYECVPVPEEERFWNGTLDDLMDGLVGESE
jgi:hypothetical protein